MPTQILALEEGGPPRLLLAWEGDYMRNFTVLLDGEMIGRIEGGQPSLREGHTLDLPDGSELTIRLTHSFLFSDIQVLRNGVPLPGSSTDPLHKLTVTVQTAFWSGIVSLLFGLLILFGRSEMRDIAFSNWSIVAGVALIALSVAISRCSVLAIWLAIGAMLADGVLAIQLTLQEGVPLGTPPMLGMLLRVVVAAILWRGTVAIRQLTEFRTP